MGYKPKPSAPGIAVAGFICSLAGFLIFPLLCVVGLFLSISGRKKARAIGASTGLATAGVVIGAIGTVLFVLGVILIAILIATGDWETTTTTTYTILPFLF